MGSNRCPSLGLYPYAHPTSAVREFGQYAVGSGKSATPITGCTAAGGNGPGDVCLYRSDLGTDIIAMQTAPCFEAQRVSGAKTGWSDLLLF